MSFYADIRDPAPPVRENELPHHVKVTATGWHCLVDCQSCTAAGFWLRGPLAASSDDPKPPDA